MMYDKGNTVKHSPYAASAFPGIVPSPAERVAVRPDAEKLSAEMCEKMSQMFGNVGILCKHTHTHTFLSRVNIQIIS